MKRNLLEFRRRSAWCWIEPMKHVFRNAAVGFGALMLSGCVAGTGYYSETYSGDL